MTSLTGASGEDFASILRSLGYRMERRPKLAEPALVVTAPDVTEAVADLAASGEDAPLAEPADGTPQPAGEETASDAVATPGIVSDVPLAPVHAPEPDGATATVQEGPQIGDPASASSEGFEAATPSDSDPLAANEASETAATGAAAPAEPVFIEVWRPGRAVRPEGRRQPRGRHREAGKNRAPSTAVRTRDAPAVGVSADAAAVPPAEGTAVEPAAPAAPSRPDREARHRRRRGPDQRFERPRREHERPPHAARPERREKAPDPNSPFAKLAALKAQLEEEAKERH
jgi:ATP-dependent RNA helicase SUPV3L1/SUV3